MKKILVLQVSALLLVSGGLAGMFTYTNVYNEVRDNIVLVLCLSCIKLQPKTITNFTFFTVDNASHPDFVLENLSKGPIFLHYSEDVCPACDEIFPVVKQLFNVEFEKKDMFNTTVIFENTNVSYVYINIDHTTTERSSSFSVYAKIRGLPMFIIVTLGYDHGIIKPRYARFYGTLEKNTDAERLAFLTEVVQESIEMYHQNSAGYHHH
jgi:thiol-disulfide isomerase/thioredoxin